MFQAISGENISLLSLFFASSPGEKAQRMSRNERVDPMRKQFCLVAVLGVIVGAAAVQALHAQAKPPAYVVAEIDVTNAEPYDKEYVPPAAKAVTDAGGKYVVRGGRTVAIFGQPPQPRIAVMVFESMEKANAAFDSAAYKEAKKIGGQIRQVPRLCRGRLGAIAVATRNLGGVAKG